ncbi:MAG: S8 family serine peptidase [Verrucomicrobiia bacterium]|jgi:subtilisin family serine protease
MVLGNYNQEKRRNDHAGHWLVNAGRSLRLIVGAVLALALVGLAVGADASHPATAYVEGEVLVKFKDSVDFATTKTVLGAHGLEWARHFDWLSEHIHRHSGLVHAKDRTTAALIGELTRDSMIETVEPNYFRWTSALPNDPDFSQLWALQNTGQTINGTNGTAGDDIDFVAAWNLVGFSSNTGVVVAVIDTGIDYTHPDLVSNMWHNPGGIPGDSYVGDYYGYDFADGVSDPSDSGYHGSHVSGTIAATGNNGVGIIGVGYRAKLMALKASSDGETFADSAVIEAIQYATMMKNGGVNIAVINASFGGGGSSTMESDAIQAAGDAGIVFCAAAGNDSVDIDTTPTYPASYRLPNMIVVAATDQNDALASFSNYGVGTVDLAAPGVSILSTIPTWFSSTTAVVYQAGNTYFGNGLAYAGTTTGITATVYNCLLGTPADFPAAVNGNIALIQRGTLTFSNKVANAMAAGAKAAIIYNNVSGNFTGTLITVGSWVPTVSLSQADGRTLLAALPTTATVVNQFDPSQIYEYLDGTSMATPHVSGTVAFDATIYPSETASQRVQRILQNIDPVAGLSGTVATGGRLNLASTLVASSFTPSVTITSPTDGTSYTNAQTVTIAATVMDSAAVNRVEFDEDGALVGTASVSPYDYDWTFTGVDNGTHRWTALVYDAANNVATSAVVTVTVSIPAPGCSYALSANTVRLGAMAATGSVNLIAGAGCAWVAATTADWITITSGGSGSGNGTIDYAIDANTNASPRTGTITARGQTFTVDQAEASPVSFTFGNVTQTCKTKVNKKTETTNTTCTVAVNLAVGNGGATESAKSEVLLWLEQGSSFDPNSGLAPVVKAVKVLKAGQSVTLKIKSQEFSGDQAGTFIFATDTHTNILAFAEVPGS